VKIWVTAVLVLFLHPPAQQQVRKGRIEGYVLRFGTSEPLASARVTIRRTEGAGQIPLPPQEPERGPEAPQAITTDSQGRFIIENLDPGSYELSATKNGFARQVYGERAPERPGTVLAVADGQTVKEIVFRLVPAGAVSGRVANEKGEPIPGILVQLLRSSYDGRGRRTFHSVSTARTNERGEFRMYLITPGRFFVSAAPGGSAQDPSMMAVNHVEEPGFVVTY
jgi:protocatechuate 3,4-dioxygenase beta subunit